MIMARRSGQQGGDQAAAIHHHSSLALLQERFNQLQKTREMRQERELMRLLSEAHERHASTTTTTAAAIHYHHQQQQPSSTSSSSSSISMASCYYYDSELMMFYEQRPSNSQLELSLIRPPQLIINRPDSGNMKAAAAASQETKSWLFGTNLLGLHNSSSSVPLKFDDSSAPDVDTSLHL